MNKRIVFVMSLVLVIAFSGLSFASPLEHEGSLEFQWDKDSKLTHSEWAKLEYSVRKDFGQGFSAGLSMEVSPDDTGGLLNKNWDGWANMDFGHTFVSLSSWKEFSGANYFFTQGYKLPGGPGAVVDFKQFDDITLQGHLGNYWGSNDAMNYTFGAKAGYTLDKYNVSAGFHGKKQDELLYGIFAGVDTELADGVGLQAEVAYRNDLEDWRCAVDEEGNQDWWMEEYHSGVAVGAQVDYEGEDLLSSLLVFYKGPLFRVKDWDDDIANNPRDLFLMNEWSGTLLALDLEYDVTPYLVTKAKVDYLLGVVDSRDDSNLAKVDEIDPFGFRVDASYRATLGTTISGWYSHYADWKKIGAGVTYWDWEVKGSYDLGSKFAEAEAVYTFVDGFQGIIHVNKPYEGDLGYGLKLKITF